MSNTNDWFLFHFRRSWIDESHVEYFGVANQWTGARRAKGRVDQKQNSFVYLFLSLSFYRRWEHVSFLAGLLCRSCWGYRTTISCPSSAAVVGAIGQPYPVLLLLHWMSCRRGSIRPPFNKPSPWGHCYYNVFMYRCHFPMFLCIGAALPMFLCCRLSIANIVP
jgi:hypothetical protein